MQHPAEPRRAPGRAARADPEHDRADDPRPGQGRLPRPVARPLADRHDRRAVRRPARRTRPPAGWEVDRLLDTVNATMDVDLTRDDVVGTYAGLRPLIAPSDGSTVKASREHRVTVESNGVVRIGGGKYTTYRVMARDAIDAVLGPTEAQEASERHRRPPAGRRSRRGRPGPDRRRAVDDPGRRASIGPETAARLVARHGTEATAVVALGAELDLLRPLVPGRPFLEAEVAWAVRQELALLARRRPCPPDAAGPGASRPRRRDRPAGRADPRRRARLGRVAPAPRGRVVSRDGAARVFGPAAGAARAAGRRGVDRPWTDAGSSVIGPSRSRAHHPADGVPGRPAASFFDGLYDESDPGRGRLRSWSRSSPSSSRGGPAGSQRRGGIRDGRASSLAVVLAVGLPLTWYLASPIWVRTELIEPEPAAQVVATPVPRHRSTAPPSPSISAAPRASVARSRPHSRHATIASGEFHGTDDFHFGRGTARIVETAPGAYTLRLDRLLGP